MTTEQKQLIKATVPVLKESGLLLTTHFYQRVFSNNAELKNTFDMANQENGRQPMALAMAVLAYAENIDDPSVLLTTLQRIGHKHTSLAVRPEHYPVIGRHLIASISEVLGTAATPALLDAWTTAYEQLAHLMISIEADLYAAQVTKQGSWTGWRPFIVNAKIADTGEKTTVHLYPADGATVADYGPGQYLNVRLFMPELKLFQPHPYRIESAPNGLYYTILVKRKTNKFGSVSNQLLDEVQPGDQLDLSAPAGVCPVAIPVEKPTVAVRMGGCPMHQAA
ncbi:globin domain-containing protein [Spirosoma flavum]|uniref:nitric oxide dioxygenase n=1 Tax=Spirosoma flavum TaxID=2048557 RepID=A0ABW6ANL3_9BACT